MPDPAGSEIDKTDKMGASAFQHKSSSALSKMRHAQMFRAVTVLTLGGGPGGGWG